MLDRNIEKRKKKVKNNDKDADDEIMKLDTNKKENEAEEALIQSETNCKFYF